MDQIKNLLPGISTLKELQTQSLQPTECNDISLYADPKATRQEVATEVRKLASVFPTVTSDFVIVLIDRLIANGFTKQRLIDAIGSVIDNCQYPPKVADIIGFDRKVKTYSYAEMCAMCSPYKTSDDFEMVKINNQSRWIEK